MSDGLTTFRVDSGASQIWIDARSTLHPIHGEGRGLEGHVDVHLDGSGLDVSGPPKALISLAVERLSSGSSLQDMEMRRRIESGRFPTITAELREVKPLDSPARYRVWVDLTFHGMTRRIAADVTASLDPERGLTIEGRSGLDVRGFGITPPRLLGLQVDPEIKLRIRIVAQQER
jgi:hypothetical protein